MIMRRVWRSSGGGDRLVADADEGATVGLRERAVERTHGFTDHLEAGVAHAGEVDAAEQTLLRTAEDLVIDAQQLRRDRAECAEAPPQLARRLVEGEERRRRGTGREHDLVAGDDRRGADVETDGGRPRDPSGAR